MTFGEGGTKTRCYGVPPRPVSPAPTRANPARFTPGGITALVAVGLVLLDDLYDVQDALHGDASTLPVALAGFLSMAEGVQQQLQKKCL
ncbi:hypothetical protein [Accumulibacter sp.]|uniref:hypothetical protein n=1 Tax=Accumulibacter sp. TaxID=2053492 RepID=UPI002C11DD34|nr:hypothetical protein [Accumulibacter sp.]HRF05223.1 hypothetical protein [Accumulibacter sp.]